MYSSLMKEYDWKYWLLENINQAFWQEKKNRIEFLMWLKNELNIIKYVKRVVVVVMRV